jgi:hypothetical protein
MGSREENCKSDLIDSLTYPCSTCPHPFSSSTPCTQTNTLCKQVPRDPVDSAIPRRRHHRHDIQPQRHITHRHPPQSTGLCASSQQYRALCDGGGWSGIVAADSGSCRTGVVFHALWGHDVGLFGASVGGVEVWNGLEAEVEEGEVV